MSDIDHPYLNRAHELFRRGDGDDYEVLDGFSRGDLGPLADYIGRRGQIGDIIADAIRSMITGLGDSAGAKLEIKLDRKGRPEPPIGQMIDEEMQAREVAYLVENEHQRMDLDSAIAKVAEERGLSKAKVKRMATKARRDSARSRIS